MAKKILGIAFGDNLIKLVEVDQLKTGPKVVKGVEESFPLNNNPDQQAKLLSSLLKKHQIKATETVVTTLSPLLLYKLLELPVMQDREISAAMNYKLESLLPFPVKDAIVNYYRIAETKERGKYLFFVAAISKDYVKQISDLLKQAGLKMLNIVPFSSALSASLQAKDNSPYALISLGRRSTVISLVKKSQVVFAREVKVGGDSIAHSMEGVVQTEQGRSEIDFSRAEQLINAFGIPLEGEEDVYLKEAGVPSSRIMAMMRPALEKIAAEILRTFEYYRSETGDQTEFVKFYIGGSLAKTKNLFQYFKRQLEIEVLPFPLEGIAADKKLADSLPRLMLAFGAALASKDFLDLLPEEYKHPLLFRLKKLWSYWFLSLVYFLVLVVIAFSLFLQHNSLLQQSESISHKLKSLGVGAEQSEALAQAELLNKNYNRAGAIDRFVSVMNFFDQNTPKAIYFNKVTYDAKKDSLKIVGLILNDPKTGGLIGFVEQMRANDLFKLVDLGSLQKSNQYSSVAYNFELNCSLSKGVAQ